MTLPNSAEVQSFIDGFRPAVEQVASSLGVATAQLLEIGMRKQMADGTISLVIAVVLGVCMFFVYKAFKSFYLYEVEEEKKGGFEFMPPPVIAIIGASCLFILILLMRFAAESAILHFIAPEWMMIEEIIQLIG